MLRALMSLLQSLPVADSGAALEELAQRIVRERMSSAAIVFFESIKPVSFIGSQAAIMVTPLVGAFIEPVRLEQYAALFGDRAFLERLIQRIEELESAGEGDRPPEGESKPRKK